MPLVSSSFGGSRTEVEVTAISKQDPESPEVGWDTPGAIVSQGTTWRERRVGISALIKLKNSRTSSRVTISVPTRDFSIQPKARAQTGAIPDLSVYSALSSSHLAYSWCLGDKTLSAELRELEEHGARRGGAEPSKPCRSLRREPQGAELTLRKHLLGSSAE